MSQPDKKPNDETRTGNAEPSANNVTLTVRLRDMLIHRGFPQTGPLRITLPQEMPPGLKQQWDEQFRALTPDEEEQIHLAARRIAPRFFRERYGDDGNN